MAKRRADKSPAIQRPTRSACLFPTAISNLLLSSLPLEDQKRIFPLLEVVPLTVRDILHKPGERIEHIYFPGSGFCSIVTVFEDGGWWKSPLRPRRHHRRHVKPAGASAVVSGDGACRCRRAIG
jgi:hypothetical protein